MGRSPFPSMSSGKLKRLLQSIGYREASNSGSGSHCWLEHPSRPRIRWAFHARELSPKEVKDVLLRQAAMDRDEALEVIRRG